MLEICWYKWFDQREFFANLYIYAQKLVSREDLLAAVLFNLNSHKFFQPIKGSIMAHQKISNPLTVIAIFSGLIDTSGTIILPQLKNGSFSQIALIVFLVVFPFFLVGLFFFVLYNKYQALYAPSDYLDDNTFKNIFDSHGKVDQSSALPNSNDSLDADKTTDVNAQNEITVVDTGEPVNETTKNIVIQAATSQIIKREATDIEIVHRNYEMKYNDNNFIFTAVYADEKNKRAKLLVCKFTKIGLRSDIFDQIYFSSLESLLQGMFPVGIRKELVIALIVDLKNINTSLDKVKKYANILRFIGDGFSFNFQVKLFSINDYDNFTIEELPLDT